MDKMSIGVYNMHNMKRTRESIIIIMLAIALLFAASATEAATRCAFQTNSATLAFGILDPGLATNVTITSIVTFKCTGAASIPYTITDDDGLHSNGINANRMLNQNIPNEYLPYSFSYLPSSGNASKNTVTTVTVSATVQGSNYQNAYFGPYTDTVTMTINP